MVARVIDAPARPDPGGGVLAAAAARAAKVAVEGKGHLRAEARGEAQRVLGVEAAACGVCVDDEWMDGLLGAYAMLRVGASSEVHISYQSRTLAEVDLAQVGVRVGLVEVGDGRGDARAEDLHGRHVLKGDACRAGVCVWYVW